MTEKPYDPNYPVMIPLDREVPSIDMATGGKKGKSKAKKMGASLYVTGGPELAQIPKHGYALIEFDRRDAGVRSPGDGKDEGHAELEIHTLCLEKKGGGDMASDFASFAKKSGVDTEGMGGESEAEETPAAGEDEEET